MKKIILSLVLAALLFLPIATTLYAEDTTTTTEETTTTTVPEDTTTTTVPEDTTTTTVPEETTTTTVPEDTTTTTVSEETTTTSTIEEEEDEQPTGIMPGSPFYFLKNWWRGLRLGFTFNPVKRAQLETTITEDVLDELANVATNSQRSEAIQKALDNYSQHAEKLRIRLETLKETSENPNIDKLLDRLSELQTKHEEVFNRITNRFAVTEQIRQQIENTMNNGIFLWQVRKEQKNNFLPRIERQAQTSTESFVPQFLVAPQHQGEVRHVYLLEGVKNRLENVDLEKLTSEEQAKLEDWEQKIEEKIETKKETLEKQGISSSTLDEIINKSLQVLPRLKNLPQAAPKMTNSPRNNPPGD